MKTYRSLHKPLKPTETCKTYKKPKKPKKSWKNLQIPAKTCKNLQIYVNNLQKPVRTCKTRENLKNLNFSEASRSLCWFSSIALIRSWNKQANSKLVVKKSHFNAFSLFLHFFPELFFRLTHFFPRGLCPKFAVRLSLLDCYATGRASTSRMVSQVQGWVSAGKLIKTFILTNKSLKKESQM